MVNKKYRTSRTMSMNRVWFSTFVQIVRLRPGNFCKKVWHLRYTIVTGISTNTHTHPPAHTHPPTHTQRADMLLVHSDTSINNFARSGEKKIVWFKESLSLHTSVTPLDVSSIKKQ